MDNLKIIISVLSICFIDISNVRNCNNPLKNKPKKASNILIASCTDAVIYLYPDKGRYKVGDRFEAVAKSGTTICKGGKWTWEDGLSVVKEQENPLLVDKRTEKLL